MRIGNIFRSAWDGIKDFNPINQFKDAAEEFSDGKILKGLGYTALGGLNTFGWITAPFASLGIGAAWGIIDNEIIA